MKNIKVITTILLAMLVTTGCSNMKKLPIKMADKNTGEIRDIYVAATTVTDSLDQSLTVGQLGYDSGKTEADGTPIIVQIAAEQKMTNTVLGQIAIGVTNGTGAAYLQKRGMENSARTYADGRKCPEGTLQCNSSNIQVAGATAASASESNSDSAAAINSSSCPSGQCTAIPIFDEGG
jgi:hypothetical protein